MHTVHTMIDDILNHANMQRNQPTWYVKIGSSVINNAFIMEIVYINFLRNILSRKIVI